MVPQSIPPFVFTWGKLSDLINQDQSFSQMVCSDLCTLQDLFFCMLTNMGVINWQVRRGCKWEPGVSIPTTWSCPQADNAWLWNAYLCLDTSVFDSTRAMFWILFQLFYWQNCIEVKCKKYNSTQWVCCRVAELCLSVLKVVDYQTFIAKVIQFTFWNHFARLSSSSCTLRCCS